MSDWIAVQSSNLARIRYREDEEALEIEFHGGRIYRYRNVPEQEFQQLRDAPSKGSYFADHIKDRYEYTRLK